MQINKPRAVFKCSEEFKLRFAHSDCLLTISVGQATHEEELFAITLDLVNKSFASCTLLVDDSLQRHNMAINTTKDANFFYEIAVKEGDLWLERNRKYYDGLTIPLRIFRWDRWLKHPNFHNKLNEIKAAVENDPIYRSTFYNSIEGFLKKYRERLPDLESFDMEKARQLSYDFVTEECAALCLWPELQCHFEIYPIRHNEAINATRERFVLPYYPNLLQAVVIAFKNIKQIKPQRFYLF
ncbi:MAG: hypothetical protein ACD_69C00020G0002 [uncultured bacterium]|nr:MAG: hypothetical protein ACD_69C00020G0002 [uncultured bacterium]HBC71270.1 hypothetical protein [Coxiellaceae bacterium]